MPPSSETKTAPPWMRATLRLAGFYNLVWGLAVSAFPMALFDWLQMERPRYPQIWQCVGMIVGVYGIGYLIAARDPCTHWPIVLVGLLGKVLGPIGFLHAAWSQALPWSMGATIVTNDLIWWIPFSAILLGALRQHTDVSKGQESKTVGELMLEFVSHRGYSLAQLAERGPLLVVFLRHSGCTFCREALSSLSRQRPFIEANGVTLAIVHMSDPMGATQLLGEYDLGDVHRFSDPSCELYEAFGLPRGSLSQLLGPSVLWRGLIAGVVKGHGLGRIVGDGFRLPGAFILQDDKILAEYRGETSADNPNFIDLVTTYK